jgi:hypothetical protein
MEIIAFVESDDCGPAAVLDSDMISIMQCGDFYIGATRCIFRGTPITCELTPEIAHKLIKKGVKCLDFQTHSE